MKGVDDTSSKDTSQIFPFLILTKDTFASKASTMAQTSTGEQISEQSTELPHQVGGRSILPISELFNKHHKSFWDAPTDVCHACGATLTPHATRSHARRWMAHHAAGSR